MFCQGCGVVVPTEAKYCPKCGTNLAASMITSALPVKPESRPITEATSVSWWVMLLFVVGNSFLAEIIGNRIAFSRVPEYPSLVVSDLASGFGRFLVPLTLVAVMLWILAHVRKRPFSRRTLVIAATVVNIVLHVLIRLVVV